MVKVCECCGHPLLDVDVQLELTRRQRDIFKAVQKSGQAGLTVNELVDRVYGQQADGGPDTAKNVMYVQRNKMANNLAKFGLRITTTKRHGAVWRLEKL